MKELQSLALNVRVLDADGQEVDLSAVEDEIEAPNYVSDADVGEAVETDDMFDSFTEKNPDEDDSQDFLYDNSGDDDGYDDYDDYDDGYGEDM